MHAVQSGDHGYIDPIVGEKKCPCRARCGLEAGRYTVEPLTGRRVTAQVESQTAPTRGQHPAREKGKVRTREKDIVGDDVKRREQAIIRSGHPRPPSVP